MHNKLRMAIFILPLVLIAGPSLCQRDQIKPVKIVNPQNGFEKLLLQNPELKAFDFLIGNWETYEKSLVNGDTIFHGPSIINVSRSLDGVSLREDWQIIDHDTLLFKATLNRLYDGVTKQWVVSYADSKLNYQVWLGKEEKNIWTFYRERYRDGKKIIVRQQWISVSSKKARQTIERSFDEGSTWVTGSIIDYFKSNR